jgi:hypothetical protein
MTVMAEISCSCGACGLVLNDSTPKMALLCACEDCRQAATWAAQRGGSLPKDILYSVYCRSDFSAARGVENMRATRLRNDGRSTRIYCKSCYSCIAIDHKISYANNVFMFQPDHCRPSFNVELAPTAMIQLRDYPGDTAPTPSEQLPVFHTFRYPQERARFLALSLVGTCFAPPETPSRGQTVRDIIAQLEPVEVLGLPQGAPITSP